MPLSSILQQADPNALPWRQRIAPQPQFDGPGQVWHPDFLDLKPPKMIDEHGGWHGAETGQWFKSMPPPPFPEFRQPDDLSYLLQHYKGIGRPLEF